MARLTITHNAVRNGLLLLAGAAVVLVTATVVNAVRPRVDSGAGSSSLAATTPALADHPGASEQVRLAFHADVETLKAQLVQDPTNQTLLLELATKFHDGHKPADAVPYYREYLSLNRTDEQAWLDLATCFAELEDWKGAEAATKSLLEVNPSNAAALYNLGAIRANAGDYDGARQLWERIRDEQPHADVAGQARDALVRLASIAG